MSRRHKAKSLAAPQDSLVAVSLSGDGDRTTPLAAPPPAVARADPGDPNYSKQPRFADVNPEKLLTNTMAWLTRAETNLPPYHSDSRRRDKWLREFVKWEPHLHGVLHGAVSIDSNRGWHLTGGRNQVYRYEAVLHNFRVAADLFGWRNGCAATSQAYYTSDLGAVVETGHEGEGGPLRGLFHTDPAKCQLTGKVDTPLIYYPSGKPKQPWKNGDYFRVVSMPSTDEDFRGLGFCAISRCMEMAKILVGILLHDQETVAVRAPKGLLLLQGITQEQWENAMTSRKQKLEEDGWRYYEGVAVLASAGVDQVDAKLFALSQLPANFSMEMFVNLTMYGYALAFGYDPSEFWPVQFGALGRGRETEMQHRKATHKGVGNFSLSMQEQVQLELPETLGFEFDQRDVEGERLEALVNGLVVEYVTKLYESGLGKTGSDPNAPEEPAPLQYQPVAAAGTNGTTGEPAVSPVTGEPVPPSPGTNQPMLKAPGSKGSVSLALLSADPSEARERALSLLAKQGIVPPEWTSSEEKETASDVDFKRSRDALLAKTHVRRAAERFPSEPIIRYHWPERRTEVLAESGESLLARQVFPVGDWPKLKPKAITGPATVDADAFMRP